jgi:uncharacterized iron-regulated membrane protein
MALFRKFLFWTHLIGGVLAGIVILIMSVTGVLLTYEKQMIAWSDREFRVTPPVPDARPLPAGTLLTRIGSFEKRQPEGLTWEADAAAPVAVSFGRETLYVDPYTGKALGKPTTGMREFMSSMRAWHRWLAAEGENRAVGKAITGASNVIFLFLVVSGIYLWMPRRWGWQQVKAVALFRGGLRGRARDFNWHNVAGFWTAVPLFFVVLSAMVISYPWFSQLVMELADGKQPAAAQPGGPGPRGGKPPAAPPVDPAQADAVFQAAFAEQGWKTLSLRFPAKPGAPFTATVSRGNSGQPQLRDTLSIQATAAANLESAVPSGLRTEVVKRETFESQSLGRRVRMWMRFVHTGEYYGVLGQTIAGIATAAGVLLVYTGFALALRRFLAWRKRQASTPVAEQAKAA